MVDLPKSNNACVQSVKTDLSNLIRFMNGISLQSFKDKLTKPESKLTKFGFAALFVGLAFIFIGIPIFLIAVGLANLNTCTANKMIPIWLCVFGGVVLFNVFINFFLIGFIVIRFPKIQPIQRVIDFVLIFFMFIWLICGSVWVFSASTVRSGGYKTCDVLVYNLAFWLIIAMWAMLVLVVSLYLLFRVSKSIFDAVAKK